MRLHLSRNYQTMSAAAATAVRQFVTDRPSALIGVATGESPLGLYTDLREAPEAPALFAKACFLQLDEWGGLPPDDPGTCESYLRRELLGPLQVDEDRYCKWQPNPESDTAECARMRLWLGKHGPMDLCILGVGLNGHLAFNEPAETLCPYAHRVTLSDVSRKHSMLESSATQPTVGFSVGMADIMRAERILLVVSGVHKAAQLTRIFNEEITTSFPASLLWLHRHVDVFADARAARDLAQRTRKRLESKNR